MASNENGSKKRSVRFSEASATTTTTMPPPKRRRNSSGDNDGGNDGGDDDNDMGDMIDRKPVTSSFAKPPKKKAERYRPNEDELDDIDEWDEREDGDEEDGIGAVPSESQLIEAKRQRRQRGLNLGDADDGDDDEHITAETSLAAEGIKIEPFHMREEETDGTGYFDGDTYVFRRQPADDGEPDAWADSLNDDDGNPTTDLAAGAASVDREMEPSQESLSSQGRLDELTKEELYQEIIPLVSDTETVARAIRRYGQLVKQQKHRKGGKRRFSKPQPSPGATEDATSSDSEAMAKTCLDILTGAASALLLHGEVDIYDTTRLDILRKFPLPQGDNVATGEESTKSSFMASTPPAATNGPTSSSANLYQWEYMGNQDNSIHGPFTTQQMLGWVQAGYFVGTQRVQIRTIQEEVESLSTQDDLLADLMEDDDNEEEDEEGENNPSKRAKKALIKGDWMWSNEVDFKKYL